MGKDNRICNGLEHFGAVEKKNFHSSVQFYLIGTQLGEKR